MGTVTSIPDARLTVTREELRRLCLCTARHRDADEVCGACQYRRRLTDATSEEEVWAALRAVALWSLEVCEQMEHEVSETGACEWAACDYAGLRARIEGTR